MRKLKMIKLLAMCVTLSMPIVSQALPKPSNPRNEMRFIDLVDWNEISASASMASKTVKTTPKPTVKPVASAKPVMLTFEQYKAKLESATLLDYKNDMEVVSSEKIKAIVDMVKAFGLYQNATDVDLKNLKLQPHDYIVNLAYFRDIMLNTDDFKTSTGKAICVSFQQTMTCLQLSIIELNKGNLTMFRKYMEEVAHQGNIATALIDNLTNEANVLLSKK